LEIELRADATRHLLDRAQEGVGGGARLVPGEELAEGCALDPAYAHREVVIAAAGERVEESCHGATL
jgi:hypothetical protein